jgi:hypothetical protein
MRWVVVMALCLVGMGCEMKPESPVKYDPLKDQSSLYVHLGGISADSPDSGKPSLRLMFSGEGKHPKEWDCTLFVEYRDPKGEAEFWGEKPTLVFNPNVAGGHEFTSHYYENKTNPDLHDNSVMFGMRVDELLFLMDYGGNYTLNGKPFRLSAEEEEAIKKAIIAAREDTNAGN